MVVVVVVVAVDDLVVFAHGRSTAERGTHHWDFLTGLSVGNDPVRRIRKPEAMSAGVYWVVSEVSSSLVLLVSVQQCALALLVLRFVEPWCGTAAVAVAGDILVVVVMLLLVLLLSPPVAACRNGRCWRGL